VEDDMTDCPGRILNDDGTVVRKITVGQESKTVVEDIVEIDAAVRGPGGTAVFLDTMCDSRADSDTPSTS